MQFRVDFAANAYRAYLKLVRRNPTIQITVNRMISILSRDPYNLSRQFDISKLKDVAPGSWRVRIGKYRIRYDVEGNRVLIHDVFHRQRGY